MKIRDVMAPNVETATSAETLERAAHKMKNRNIGFLPVVDDGEVTGVITDRDMVVHAVSAGLRPHMTTVREVMTHRAISCRADASLSEASLIMEQNHVRRLPVLERNGKLIGVVSLSDFAVKSHNERLSGHVLAKVSE
jgi:CBS domain-containing protein